MGKFKDLTGNRYGRLLVLCKVPKRAWHRIKWYCLCDCGKTTSPIGSDLVSGDTSSCGCLKSERMIARNKTHGQSGSRIMYVWYDMLRRCYNKKYHQYKDYGGRGITVCREWRRNPKTFVDWALNKGHQKGLSIDRIDNNGDYEPSNCHFVTHYKNNHNKRKLMVNNKTGYTGVSLLKSGNYQVSIQSKMFDNKNIHLGTFFDPVSAVITRNEFIIANNLPHRIQEVPNAHSG